MKYINIFLLIVFYCLAFTACDIFDPANPNYLDDLYAELAWSRAERLTVSLEFPPVTWGHGSITTTADNRRLGYNFNLEFTPSPGFSITQWRAYKTNDIDDYRADQLELGINWNWLQSPDPAKALDDTGIEFIVLAFESNEAVELRTLHQAAGGSISVRININERITLVPWCNNDPAILRTHPPMRAQGLELQTFRPTETIIIELTAPVNPATVLFHPDHIKIEVFDIDTETLVFDEVASKELFSVNWNAGLWRIIITPDSDKVAQLGLKKITVTLGEGIQNSRPASLIELVDGKISFSWLTYGFSNVEVTEWIAAFDENKNEITIEWDVTQAIHAEITYTINNSVRRTLPDSAIAINGTKAKAVIEDVSGVNGSGVRSGQAVSNIERYDISIRLLDED